jgi:hypothetical protein
MDQVHTIYAKTENLMDLIPFPPKIMVWVVLPKEVQTVSKKTQNRTDKLKQAFQNCSKGQ